MNDTFKISRYEGGSIDNWCDTDTKELFITNCKEGNFNDESVTYYKENSIEYSFNNFGFRTPDDFNDSDEGNLFLGCSHTMGVGLSLENVWSYKLNKKIGGKFWNLAQAGSGVMTSYRLLYAWKDYLNIKNIFHYIPPWHSYRFEYFANIREDKIEPVILGSHVWRQPELLQKLFKQTFITALLDDDYSNFVLQTHINAIKFISQEIGCNYYVLRDNLHASNPDSPVKDKIEARDLIHYGIEKHNFLYQKFLGEIK